MRVAAALSLTLALTLASACVQAAPKPAAPVRVTNGGQPFGMSDGAAARKAADAECGPRGVRTSIYDRFDAGAWVYPGGCA